MENNIDDFLKRKLTVNDLNLDQPDISLVNNARQRVLQRKKTRPETERFFDFILAFFAKPLHTGAAFVLIIASIFYFVNSQTGKSGYPLASQNATANYSISSSTVLASLTQYTNNKTATSSSTVLTSIITFVVRN